MVVYVRGDVDHDRVGLPPREYQLDCVIAPQEDRQADDMGHHVLEITSTDDFAVAVDMGHLHAEASVLPVAQAAPVATLRCWERDGGVGMVGKWW